MRVLITGATSGIGKGVCRELCSLQHEIVGVGRSVASAARELPSVKFVSLDLCDSHSVSKLVLEPARANKFDGLVLCAAQTGTYRTSGVHSIEDYEYLMKVNFFPNTQLLGSLVEMLNPNGSVVVVSSNTLAKSGGLASLPYACSKAALDHAALCFEKYYSKAPHFFRINIVRPGLVETGLHERTFGYSDERYRERVSLTPRKRAAKVEEVVSLIAFLLLPQSIYISGQTISVAGGE